MEAMLDTDVTLEDLQSDPTHDDEPLPTTLGLPKSASLCLRLLWSSVQLQVDAMRG